MSLFKDNKTFIVILLALNAFAISSQYLEEELIEEIVETSGSVTQNDKIMCRNEITGEPIDWFTLYKLPKQVQNIYGASDEHLNPFLREGTAYTYLTNKEQTSWKFSDLSFNDSNSFGAKTLEPLYSKNNNIGYILYNDQADKVTLIKGHTKGVLLFNDNSAIWIVHSIPHFPPKQSEGHYQIHPSQCVYGQSFLCMSFNFDQLQLIGQQLLYNYPQVYDFHIPDNLKIKYGTVLDNLMKVISGDHVKSMPWSNLNVLTTVGGEKLLSFAKFTNFQDDLYSGLVAPEIKADLLTETWNNGAGTLKSNCSQTIKYHVMNVEEVKFDFLNLKFSVHHDHSKWAVTSFNKQINNAFDLGTNFNLDQSVKIACIGDINRQEEQFKRSGGTVCFLNNENVWNQYFSIVNDIEKCEKVNDFIKVDRVKIRHFPSRNTKEKIILL